ncbi:ATP-binding protein, partial [Nocardiopsis sp. JB363]|uniref:ATP-binding protein n=1 Tax=Nocardiopsis sp. JB363 TaxID=1434837 RepID=UPI001F179F5F
MPPSRHQLLALPGCAALRCVAGSVAVSRLYTARHVPPDAPQTVGDDAVLVVSELVSNAVREGTNSPGLVGLSADLVEDGLMTLTMEVTNPHDETVAPHQEQAPDPDAEHGRGLLLVDAFTDTWGARLDSEGRLVVWASWSWLSPTLLDRGWLAGWEPTRDTAARVLAHHGEEALTLRGGETLASLHRPIASVNQVLALRTHYPEWEITYDRTETGPIWFTARRRI